MTNNTKAKAKENKKWLPAAGHKSKHVMKNKTSMWVPHMSGRLNSKR